MGEQRALQHRAILSSELGDVLDRVQERFVARTVQEELARYRILTSEEACSNDGWLGDVGNDRFLSEGTHFSRSSKRNEVEHIGHILSNGLNFLFTLIKAEACDTREQEQTVVQLHGRIPLSLLEIINLGGLDCEWDWDEQMFEGDLDSKIGHPNDLANATKYQWALDNSHAECASGDLENFWLRKWAYVFWDDERLSRTGVSRRCPRRWPNGEISVRGWNGGRSRNQEPSTEQILKKMGFCLPVDESAVRPAGDGRTALACVLSPLVGFHQHGRWRG